MPTPNKSLHSIPEGQRLINGFLKQTPRSSTSTSIIKLSGDDNDDQPIMAQALKRKRIIRDDDDDQGCTATRACTALPDNDKAEIIKISDDDEAAATQLQDDAWRSEQRASNVGRAKKLRTRTMRKKRPLPKPVRQTPNYYYVFWYSRYTFVNEQETSSSDEQEKHHYEDEAEESDMADFINDEPDEEDIDAIAMTKTTINALRNRRTWQESEFQCPLCADMRVILRTLLRHK
jgi:hypothetical protein